MSCYWAITSRRSSLKLILGFAMAAAALPAHADIHALGAMGDSLTDEYAEETYDYAANWIEQLVLYRGIDVGRTAAEAGQPGGTWGEPRRTGFELNWARSGIRVKICSITVRTPA
jgi:hypothetical protein